MSKRVAVIGAGPSGLVTVKELLEERQQPVCFERASSLGGVFRFGESDGVIWESCRLSSSGLLMAFSDFPVSRRESGALSAAEYVAYLERYAAAFALVPFIRFETTVRSVVRSEPRGWIVTTVRADGSGGEERFDAVAVCAGVNQHPSRPEFDGLDTFPGEILHSSGYRRPAQTRGRRVLVVGGGESGAEIVAEVAPGAAETVLSLRRGVAVVRRTRQGRPQDYRLCRLHHSAAHWVAHTRNPADAWKRRVYLGLGFPFAIVDKLVQGTQTVLQECFELLRPLRLLGGVAGRDELRLKLTTRRVARRLLAASGGAMLEQFGTKTDEFVRRIALGQIRLAGGIERIEGPRVMFADGSTFEPDIVILCTGFQANLPFLDDDLTREPRYFHTFNPSVGPGLGFIGFVRPAHGAVAPLAELQARWFARVQSGEQALPGDATMRTGIEAMMLARSELFRAVSGRLDHLVDYTSFGDALASLVGCKPTHEAVDRESFRFRLRFYGGPFVSAQYRLVGPHANPELARWVIEDLPASYPLPMLGVFYMRWRLSRGLHRLFGPEFAPKLRLSDHA